MRQTKVPSLSMPLNSNLKLSVVTPPSTKQAQPHLAFQVLMRLGLLDHPGQGTQCDTEALLKGIRIVLWGCILIDVCHSLSIPEIEKIFIAPAYNVFSFA